MVQPSLLEYQLFRMFNKPTVIENIKKKYSVLVIDDQDNWRDLLCEILEAQFEVSSARDYKSALAAIYRQHPPFHVVVTDLRLEDEKTGNQDGLRLAEFLNRQGEGTKTILVTGYPTIATAKRALSQLGAYDYLEKHPSDGSKFNSEEFQVSVQGAAQMAEKFRTDEIEKVKHISACIITNEQLAQPLCDGELLNMGQTYTIRLKAHDNFVKGAQEVVLIPRWEAKGKIQIKIFIYCEHMKVEPSTESYWNILASTERLSNFEFSITPQLEGEKEIFVEFEQNHHLLGRMSWKMKVIKLIDTASSNLIT